MCIRDSFNRVFCVAMCDSFCQCCGVCGLSQEYRELRTILPAETLQADYITHEPYANYFGRIQRLRALRATSWRLHTTWAVSDLTRVLCKIVLASLAFLTVLAVSGLDPNFHFANLYLVSRDDGGR